MVCRKSKKNGKVNNDSLPYIDSGAGNFESTGKEDSRNLEGIDLDEHWKEIFSSPEFEQEFKESDFRDVLPKDKGRKPPAVSTLLTGTFSNRLRILADAIKEIEREMDERIELGIAFRERIDSEVSKCHGLLKHLEDFTIGYNPSIELRRLSMERQIFTLTRELRAEDLRAWEDIISLMKERRNLVMEYKNLVNARKMLSK